MVKGQMSNAKLVQRVSILIMGSLLGLGREGKAKGIASE